MKRCERLLITKVGEETLVYNQATNQAHCLNAAADRVFALCDGPVDFETIRQQLVADLGMEKGEALAREAVELLIRQGLIEGEVPVEQPERRALLKKVLTVALLVPLIGSVVVSPASANISVK